MTFSIKGCGKFELQWSKICGDLNSKLINVDVQIKNDTKIETIIKNGSQVQFELEDPYNTYYLSSLSNVIDITIIYNED